MNMYLAILYANGGFGGIGETFTMSRMVSNLDKDTIVNYLVQEAGIVQDNIDTILVLKNGGSYPDVVEHWSSMNGDI